PAAGALTEPAACCLAGLETFPMSRDATVLVIGGGIMGLLTMALAKRRGAKRLILSDPLEERRAIAKSLGAAVVVDPTKEKLRERVMALTRDRGADVVAEAVGKPELVAEAMTLVKPGGVLQLVGVNPKGSEIPLSLWDVHYREIKIVGAFGRGTAFRRALALMPKLRVGRLITARFPLARIGEAFAHATAGRGAKHVTNTSALIPSSLSTAAVRASTTSVSVTRNTTGARPGTSITSVSSACTRARNAKCVSRCPVMIAVPAPPGTALPAAWPGANAS